MNLNDTDSRWLASNHPELVYKPEVRTIVGDLRFCGAFDRVSGKLELGGTDEHRASNSFLCDTFKVRMDLSQVGNNTWPKVYEVGGRRFDIAEQNQCDMIDLHFYEDGACCLTLSFSPRRSLSLQKFVPQLVIPFFYRLSYIERYGLAAAKDDLWGEYSHADAGIREYEEEILRIAAASSGRNQPCPCGSGSKYKRCHLDEVETVKRRMPAPSPHHPPIPSTIPPAPHTHQQ